MTEAPPLAARGPLSLLDGLVARGVLSPLDFHFARTISALEGATEETVLCAALASRAVQLGHVCVDLHRVSDAHRKLDSEGAATSVEWPSPARLIAALEQSPLCSDGRCSDGSPPTPLVLDARGRLYLHRYATYERSLAHALHSRAQPKGDVDLKLLGRGIERLFPHAGANQARSVEAVPIRVDAHRLAACVAVLHSLAVICGGPGTGKTTTVVKILALLQEQALHRAQPPLRILLLAPTGKAARRLASSVESGLRALALEEPLRAAIPTEASTIHRALGGSKFASGRFRHDAVNPLAADVVLVDEVSMVDLALLYRLMNAIRPEARVILQGDKDQLASVEAGAILGDIYDSSAAHEWSEEFAAQVERATRQPVLGRRSGRGLWDCLVSLDNSYRYRAESGIGRLAAAVNAGNASAALGVLRAARESEQPDCQLIEPGASEGQYAALEARAVAGYEPFILCTDPREKLLRLGDYRILCAHRQGPEGVQRLNQDVVSWLTRAGLIMAETTFYENRPLVITQNDYALGLFNGDVGVVVKDGGRLRVCFESSEGLRFLAPGRLPPHETVFAMTIHKSQGSEFDAVSVVLPEAPSPLLGRELVYTALTRARRRVDLFAHADVIRTAISRSVQRASGLHDALWG